MFDIGWSEMAVIMLLALIVIGPKDLPRVARTVGQWVRKGRMLAREFQSSLEEMAKEADLDDVKKEIEKVGRTDLKKTIEKTVDPKGELAKAFDVQDNAGKKAGDDQKAAAEKTSTEPAAKANGKAVEDKPAATAETPPAEKKTAEPAKKAPAAKKTAARTTPAKSETSTPKTAASPKKTASTPRSTRTRSKAKAAASEKGSTGGSNDDGGAQSLAAKSG
ncbi:MAG: Sec-independent protein translocase protein TatB [Alphaproteobacteria bacterium]